VEIQQVKGSIRFKLIAGVLAIEAVLTVVFATILVLSFQQNLRVGALRSVEKSAGVYDIILKNDTKMLSAALDTFATNEDVKRLYADHQDREALYAAVRDLYENNKNRHGITHFYFIDKDGSCYLRVHKKAQFGDKVNRETFVQARDSGRTASGIELGKTAFALRVVSPYRQGDNLLGYVELGEEIDHFDSIVKKETGVEVAVLVEKPFLNESDYRAGRKGANQPDDWGDLKDYALVSTTLADRAFVAASFPESEAHATKAPTFLGTVKQGDRVLAKGGFPLKDAAGRQVGAVLVLHDVTDQSRNERNALLLLVTAAVVLFAISLLVAVQYLRTQIITPLVDLSNRAIEISMGNVDKKLETERTDEIGLLIRSFERMRVSLKKSLAMLAKP
jgi:nitrogen fixation/metabolism regulation signal transduction histidine kinase